jgi:endonuclease/exonuclease/phosphatase family metal-dependent hydrolase
MSSRATALLLVVVMAGCRQEGETGPGDAGVDGGDVAASGLPEVLVGTWNLRNFSEHGPLEWRLDDIRDKILELDLDLLAVQELRVIEGTGGDTRQAFDALVDELPGYDGIHNPWNPSDTVVGLVYRTASVSVISSQALFQDDWYAFPRDPLEARILVTKEGDSVEFTVIVLHLKAYSDAESFDRRRDACEKLEGYLSGLDGPVTLILGDLNDNPYDPYSENAFADTFLFAEPEYYFVTMALPPESSTSTGWYHIVDGVRIDGEFIDHAIATGDLHRMFRRMTPRIVAVPESQYDEWTDSYSDHFPVVVEFDP